MKGERDAGTYSEGEEKEKGGEREEEERGREERGRRREREQKYCAPSGNLANGSLKRFILG